MKWPYLKSLFARQTKKARRQPARTVRLYFEQLEGRLNPSVVLTYHDDLQSSGLNDNETQLTPANVNVNTFGKLSTTLVDGQVYAEPLVDTGVAIAAGPNSSANVAGIHDVVFVATENDSLYAIDASEAGGAILWHRSFTNITTPGYVGTTPGTNVNNPLGATAITTVSSGDVGSSDISPEIGITGTPVIDSTTNTLYVVAATKETIGGKTYFVQLLHAINIGDGTDQVAPYVIGTTTSGNTNNTQIFAYGTGDGHVTDPYYNTGKQVVQFNALTENQRPALSLEQNAVYVEWASHGDNGPYHGWVAEWDVSNLATSGMVLKGVLCTSPNDGLAGIWMGGGQVTFETDGSAFYFETGNGSGGAPTLNAQGFPNNANYNEAVVKAEADPTTTANNQNSNGWGIKVVDYFIPYNVASLDGADSDFGSGAPLLLPDSAGIPGHAQLLLAAGKAGAIYLIDRNKMGHFNAVNDNVINAVPNGSGHITAPNLIAGSLSTAAYYDGNIYWSSGYSGPAKEFDISSSGTVSVESQTTATLGYIPGSATVSADGTIGGIVWIMDRNANEIHAYNANSLATEVWNSSMKVGGGDKLGAVVKFAVPTVANGEVFVGTSDSLVIYGLNQQANAVPTAPVAAANTLSGSSVNLTWTDSTPIPNTASGYLIEDSTNGSPYTQLATAPAGATSISVGGLLPLTPYSFIIQGFNAVGDSQDSNVAVATTTNQLALLDFSGGFAGSTSSLTYNGTAAIKGARLELTNGGSNQAGTAFSTHPVDITGFNTQFDFQLSAGTNTADGFTFTIQDIGATAKGPSGGGLGYGPASTGSAPGIGKSVAVKFDLYNNQGEGVDSTGVYKNGVAPTNVGSINLAPLGINLHLGDIFQVNMGYDGSVLTVVILDTNTGKSATQTYTIDIAGTIGSSTAYVGFTGGTGGSTATQDILSWILSPNATVSPNAPSGLGATPASATSVTLNWTNNATNQTGYHLDRATDPDFTQNLITETLPAAGTSFTDTATGLAPGGTFYYELTAFNRAGDSGESNPAPVSIPLAPPKPTNQEITNVAANEIDITWQDNAGHQADNYIILRAVNHGSFTTVANLPPTSRTAPSPYSWSDTNVNPGTYYEYHIEAVNVSGNNDFAGVNATTLTAPPILTATPGNNVVNLSWTAPIGAVSYNIYAGTSMGGEGPTPVVTDWTGTTYSDTTAVNGNAYFYFVTAVNSNASPLPSESLPSNEATAIPAIIPAPAAPNVVTATPGAANNGAASVVLSWSTSSGATNYNIYRALASSGETTPALITGVAGNSYTDSAVSFGVTYFYEVTAVGPGGEGNPSGEATATPLFAANIRFTAQVGGKVVPNYLNDVGLVYGSRVNGLTFGWNIDNTANGRERDVVSNSLEDGFAHMQKSNNPNAWWGIAVPNGTYSVHLLAGDPTNTNSVYKIDVGGTLSGNTVSGGTLAINGTPTSSNLWFSNTVTVTVTGGVLYVSNAPGSNNNKINEIDITELAPPVVHRSLVQQGVTKAAIVRRPRG